MPKIDNELLTQAFIQPIRFALLVDDEFPVYPRLAEVGLEEGVERDRARELFNFCRSHGWLCDVDNGVDVAQRFQREKHLHQSDLLVLDYHLDRSDSEDPSAALRILQSLSVSVHFNLVIIYTGADPKKVAREVAFSLGAGTKIEQPDFDTAQAWVEDADPQVLEALKTALNVTVLDEFLMGKGPGTAAEPIKNILNENGARGAQQINLIRWLCYKSLADKLSNELVQGRDFTHRVKGSFGGNSSVSWVTKANVFAVVVNKDQEPNTLLDHLTQALTEWDPSPVQVMMVHARTEVERTGGLYDGQLLDRPEREAGWLLRVLLEENDFEKGNVLRELYGRLFERLISKTGPTIASFGARAIANVPGVRPINRAKELVANGPSLNDVQIYHAINEFLCSDICPDEHVTTGVILRSGGDYWLCTSPACDLVPDQNLRGWDGELDPLRPITAARLSPIRGLTAIGEKLKSATLCRSVFTYEDGKPIALEVSDDDSRQMKLELILLENKGYIRDGRVRGHLVIKDANSSPDLKSVDFDVVALLRTEYASRLLAESGYQRSRIGVDFINLPRVPD